MASIDAVSADTKGIMDPPSVVRGSLNLFKAKVAENSDRVSVSNPGTTPPPAEPGKGAAIDLQA